MDRNFRVFKTSFKSGMQTASSSLDLLLLHIVQWGSLQKSLKSVYNYLIEPKLQNETDSETQKFSYFWFTESVCFRLPLSNI